MANTALTSLTLTYVVLYPLAISIANVNYRKVRTCLIDNLGCMCEWTYKHTPTSLAKAISRNVYAFTIMLRVKEHMHTCNLVKEK